MTEDRVTVLLETTRSLLGGYEALLRAYEQTTDDLSELARDLDLPEPIDAQEATIAARELAYKVREALLSVES